MKHPFLLIDADQVSIEGRGYESVPSQFNYDSLTQTSNLLYMGGGGSSPTTMSSVGTDTGVITVNYDDSNNTGDDTGSD